MSKVKAIILTILFFVSIYGLLFATAFVKYKNISLYPIITSGIAGWWIGTKVNDFYQWLRTKHTTDK